MNENDSEVLAGILEKNGFSETDKPEKASIALVNTCTVRQSAEDKAFGFIYELKKLKKDNPDFKIGVCGCLSQQEKEKLVKRLPFVDFVLGPGSIHELESLIVNRKPKIGEFIENCNPELRNLPQARKPSTTAYVSIMYGCDNYCSYCIVPYVRGREVSRPVEDIINEVKELDKSIFKEVVLLGQNVNSYRDQRSEVGDRTGRNLISDLRSPGSTFGLAELLKEVHEIDGIERIRFMTSHPKDMTLDIVKAVKELPKVCEHFHLPLQSGDDEILKQMNRGYDIHYYSNVIKMIKKEIPGAVITSDVIVGFPGESDEQFQNSVKAIKEFDFDVTNTLTYSDRQGTAASKIADKISEDIKKNRLQNIMKVVGEIALRKNQKLVGKTLEILVYNSTSGRTRTNKIVKISKDPSLIGKLINVKIKEAQSWVLKGA